MQNKINLLEGRVFELESIKVPTIVEPSTRNQEEPSRKLSIIPFLQQGHLQQTKTKRSKKVDALIKEVIDLKMQLESSQDTHDYNRETIVRNALVTLHEKIDMKLFNLYEAYKILYLAINKMEDDRTLVKPTYQKWIAQVQKMKKVELFARIYPNASLNAMPTAKIVKYLNNFSIFPEHIVNRLMELKDSIESYQDTLVPPFLEMKKNVKEFTTWKLEAITEVGNMVKIMEKDMIMTLF